MLIANGKNEHGDWITLTVSEGAYFHVRVKGEHTPDAFCVVVAITSDLKYFKVSWSYTKIYLRSRGVLNAEDAKLIRDSPANSAWPPKTRRRYI
jgi:hypothetical protein